MNFFLKLVYRLFYTYFDQINTPKGRDPADGAALMLIMSGFGLMLSTLWYMGLWFTDLYSGLIKFSSQTVGVKKFTILILSIVGIFLNWMVVRYTLFSKLKVSKIDGKSPYLEFTPSKRFKVFAWVFGVVSIFSPIILRTSEVLFMK